MISLLAQKRLEAAMAHKAEAQEVLDALITEVSGALSKGQILTLNSVPVELIPAPGPGKAIIVDEMEVLHSYSTAAYTGGGDLSLTYEDISATVILDMDVSLITNASSAGALMKPSVYDLDAVTGTAFGFDIHSMANVGLKLMAASADFAAGNAANILKYRIKYRVITLLS